MAEPYGRRNKFLSLSDLKNFPAPRWLIQGICEVNSLVMLAGPPGSFKSFLALDWILSMAVGKKWNDREVLPARVLYVLGEGRASLYKRMVAWIAYNHLSSQEMARLEANFRVCFDVPQMAVKSSVDGMLADLAGEGFSPGVIVIDTFARSFVGLDENSPKDTGLWIESAERLRSIGYTVLFLHHTRKNTEFGLQYRGSTAILGAMDTALMMQRDLKSGITRLEVTKQKDHDEGSPLFFKRAIVKTAEVLALDRDGVCVLAPTVPLDERFTEKYEREIAAIDKLLSDATYKSDRDRAAVLATSAEISLSAAQSRVRRRREELDEQLMQVMQDEKIFHMSASGAKSLVDL